MKVSFILLAHEAPSKLKDLIEVILKSGSDIFVHHDLNAPSDLECASKKWGLEKLSGKIYFADRVRVAWGEWSIVQGTLNCLRLARSINYQCEYMMLISGSCMPIKPVEMFYDYLKYADKDYIEVVNADENIWVMGGIQNERWTKFHFFNYRFSRTKFKISKSIQGYFGINRTLPLHHTPYIGSQWWNLRVSTIESILNILDQHPAIEKFYKYTCVPDEHFFQTLIANIIPLEQISKESLTRYSFNSYGVPRVYHDDDYVELLYDSKFFARKISNNAKKLRNSLIELFDISCMEFDKYCADRFSNHRQTLKRLHSRKINALKKEWINPYGQDVNFYGFLRSIPNRITVVVNFTLTKNDFLCKLITKDNSDVVLDFSFYNSLNNHDEERFVQSFISDHVATAAEKNDVSDIYILANSIDFSLIERVRWSYSVSVSVLYDNAEDLECLDIEKTRALVKNSYCNYNEVLFEYDSFDSSIESDYKQLSSSQRFSLPVVDIVIASDVECLSMLKSKYGCSDEFSSELSELILFPNKRVRSKIFVLDLTVDEISRLRKYYYINIIFDSELLFDIDSCTNSVFYARIKRYIEFYQKFISYKKEFAHLALVKFNGS